MLFFRKSLCDLLKGSKMQQEASLYGCKKRGTMEDRNKKLLQETVEALNVIDDALFRKMAEDKEFCEEVISTILEEEIKILEVTEQKDIMNLQGRSVILDALCEGKDGRRYNIEVQKPDTDDHQRRVRYNGSCITCNFTRKGSRFLEIPDVVIIFISRFDVFRQEKTTYHIDRVIRETGKKVENGFSEIYVNAAIDDGSRIAKLMDIFTNVARYDYEMFPKTSRRKEQFKKKEGGASEEMCELVEAYAQQYAEEETRRADEAETRADEAETRASKAETRADEAETRASKAELENIWLVENCSRNLHVTVEEACKILGVEKEKYEKQKASLEQKKEAT